MRTRTILIGAPMALFALVLLGGAANKKYVPKANEELNGTWICDVYARVQKEVISPSGSDIYWLKGDTAPAWQMTGEIVNKWTDSKGNVWYKTFGTVTACPGQKAGMRCPALGSKWQSLEKISKSGTVREGNTRQVMEFSSKRFPTKINPNPKAGFYYTYSRAEQ